MHANAEEEGYCKGGTAGLPHRAAALSAFSSRHTQSMPRSRWWPQLMMIKNSVIELTVNINKVLRIFSRCIQEVELDLFRSHCFSLYISLYIILHFAVFTLQSGLPEQTWGSSQRHPTLIVQYEGRVELSQNFITAIRYSL